MSRANRMKKRYKTPSDLRRDHRNFTSHLAGDREVSFDNFDKENIGQYVAGVESNNDSIVIKRPKGRLTFNSNLLTAGQIKFSNHELSGNVRNQIARRLFNKAYAPKSYDEEHPGYESAPEGKTKIHKSAHGSWSGFNQAKEVYDAVYNILENFRASKKSAKHFNRPKILKDHLKDIAKAQGYGYETNLEYTEVDDGKEWYNLDRLQFDVDWNELRQWVYSNLKLKDIKNPVIESIVKRHKSILMNASDSLNNISPIHAALTVALDFEMSAQDSFGNGIGGPIVCGKKSIVKTTAKEDEDSEYGHDIYTQKSLNHDVSEEDLEDLATEIMESGVQEYQKGINERLGKQGLSQITIDPNDDNKFEDVRKQIENLKNIEKMNVLCTGGIAENEGIVSLTNSIDLSSIHLDESLDRANQGIGSRGYKLTRRAWELPTFGNINVFKKHPPTSADLITLIDGSGSMGYLRSETEGQTYRRHTYPLQQAGDMVMAIRKRFPDSRSFVFGDYPRTTKYEDNRQDAALYEIKDNQFPKYPASGTPLCGSLKALEKEFVLDHARIVIATDGDANWCKTGDPYECVYNILTSWRNKGVRIATLFTPNYEGQTMPKSLHGDVTISAEAGMPIDSSQIKQVFNFIKG